MSRWLEASIEGARAQSVPWDAARAARVERSIAERRARSVVGTPLSRLMLGGLASAALCGSVIFVSQLIRQRGPSEERFEAAAPLLAAEPPEPAAASGERPLGDGGFD